MKISCKCITYGRTHLLVEALHSFLVQDCPGKLCELIIVNDYPLQKLKFDHPLVKIYNLDETFLTIGEKENYAIERCSGELIAVFDDDDIAMPWHISNIYEYWKEDTNILHWNRAVYYNDPAITAITAIGNSGIVYSKKAWKAIGKSPIENAGGDMTLVKAIHALDDTKIVHAAPPDNEVSWFYRWSLPTCYHQSGCGADNKTRPNIVQRNAAYIESLRASGQIPTGEVELIPKWRFPYEKMLSDFVNKK